MLIDTNIRYYRLALLFLFSSLLPAYCEVGDASGAKAFSTSLRSIERNVNKRKVVMEELEPELKALLQKATTDSERATVYKYWGDAFRVRQQYVNAVASYDRSQELDPKLADSKRSPVPYYKDLCKVEFIYDSMGLYAPVVLAISIICACLFLRIQPINRNAVYGLAIFVIGWIILSYGVTFVMDAKKVADYPVGNQETGGNYVFVFLGPVTNPYFWRFVLWGVPLLIFYWLMAVNHKANRFVKYSIFPALLLLTGALTTLIQFGFSWFPSRYGPERIPYLSTLALAHGQVAWFRPMLLCMTAVLALACIVATVIGLRRKSPWLHRPCQFMATLTSAVALVALFQDTNRDNSVHQTAEASYYRAPEIEFFVREHPDSFVNLHAEEAESEELKRFILDNTPSVPPELFKEKRRDDAK